MISALIFDAWGTLFRNATEEAPLDAMNRYLGKTFYDPEYLAAFEDVASLDSVGDLDASARLLLNRIHHPCDDETVNTVAGYMRQAFTSSVVMYDDARETLPVLKKKYKIGLISNSGILSAQNLRSRFPLDTLFDHVLFSYETRYLKPQPEMFYRMLELLGISDPQSAAYIGDHPIIDVSGAAAARLIPVLIDRDHRAGDCECIVCNTLFELESRLDRSFKIGADREDAIISKEGKQ